MISRILQSILYPLTISVKRFGGLSMKRALVIALLLLALGLAAHKTALNKQENGAVLEVVKQDANAESFAVEVSAEEFRTSLLRIYPDLVLEGHPSSWLGERIRGEGIMVGGRGISERTLREIFLLGKGDFTLCWTGEAFLFEVNSVDKSYAEG